MARADSEFGSWKPPADKLLATGRPNTAAAMKTRTPIATTRRGAAMANRAIPCSMWSPSAARGKARRPHDRPRKLNNANLLMLDSVFLENEAGRPDGSIHLRKRF